MQIDFLCPTRQGSSIATKGGDTHPEHSGVKSTGGIYVFNRQDDMVNRFNFHWRGAGSCANIMVTINKSKLRKIGKNEQGFIARGSTSFRDAVSPALFGAREGLVRFGEQILRLLPWLQHREAE